jgi:hypothetical protein
MGGLWEKVPVMGAIGLIFSMASLGLPGLGNFIAEFLILIGAFKANILMSSLASLGLIAATIYSLRIVQKVFLGKKNTDWAMNDLTVREKMVSASLVIAILWLGLFPQPVINTAKPAILKTLKNQKEVSWHDQVNRTNDYFINTESIHFIGCTPQPPQGGANALSLGIFHLESVSTIPSNNSLTMGYQLKSSQRQIINPPLVGWGVETPCLWILSNFRI